MPNYTENYNLKKPLPNENYNVQDQNDNMDIIDTALKAHDDALATKETPAGAQAKVDAALASAKDYTDKQISAITPEQIGAETPAGAQAKADAVQANLDAHLADYEQHTSYAIATGTNTYTATIQGITTLVEGMSIKVKFQNANTGAATLNINGLGTKAIKKSNGNDLASGNIKAGQILHLVYTGSVFQLLGEGGEYGTAQPEHVLEGYTIGTEEGLKTGTMPNRGAVTNTITTQGGSYIIPAGYHNGSGIVTAQFTNLVPENIKQGVNIGGVVGTAYIHASPPPSDAKVLFWDGNTYGYTWQQATSSNFRSIFIYTTTRWPDDIYLDVNVTANDKRLYYQGIATYPGSGGSDIRIEVRKLDGTDDVIGTAYFSEGYYSSYIDLRSGMPANGWGKVRIWIRSSETRELYLNRLYFRP